MVRGAESILFLTGESPFPSGEGSLVRDSHLIQLLGERRQVEILCFDDGASSCPVEITRVVRSKPSLWNRFFSPLGYDPGMVNVLAKRARPGRVLWVSRLSMARYIPVARKLGYRVVFDQHRLERSGREQEWRAGPYRLPSLLAAAQWSFYEKTFCGASHLVVTGSDFDASRLQRIAPGVPVHVIPPSVDASEFERARAQPGASLVFAGKLDHWPNAEGLHWFVAEVLPRLRGALGQNLPKIIVAGENPSASLARELRNAGIDLREGGPTPLDEAAIFFVPVLKGTGSRQRILEAMAAGRAVVSTNRGVEGLVLTPGHDFCIAEQADRFAGAIVKLIREPAHRAAMGARAAKTVEARYDWRCARPVIERVLTSAFAE